MYASQSLSSLLLTLKSSLKCSLKMLLVTLVLPTFRRNPLNLVRDKELPTHNTDAVSIDCFMSIGVTSMQGKEENEEKEEEEEMKVRRVEQEYGGTKGHHQESSERT